MLLLLDWSVVLFVAFVVLFVEFVVVCCALADSACFFPSRAKRSRSASLLPEATRLGFLAVAGFLNGTSEVMFLLVVGAAVSSGLVSSGCASIVCIYKNLKTSKIPVRFLSGFCQIPIRFLPDCQPHQIHLVGSLPCLSLGVWELLLDVQALFRTLCVCSDKGSIG